MRMMRMILFRRVTAFVHVVIWSLLFPFCLVQAAAGHTQSTPGQTPGGPQPDTGRSQPGPQPVSRDRAQPLPDSTSRPIYLSGSVRLADGTPPPDRVLIERICNDAVRPEAYTDSTGNFSFLLGERQTAVFADASVGGDSLLQNRGGGGLSNSRGGVNPRDLIGCEIRGRLTGFQSDSIILTGGNLDEPKIGVIRLHRLANVEGFTFSGTTMAAPKNARSAFEAGVAHVKKQKWSDAEREFRKAVQIYPKYAVAWYELGRVYEQGRRFEDANRAHTEAISSDPKFISPYHQLAVIAASERRWDDAALYTSEVLKLNPYAGRDVYFYSAVANYNLQRIDVAENHARQAAALDVQHGNPNINHLLGVILTQKREYKAAAENLRIYLKLSPNTPDAPAVEKMLVEIDKASGEQTVQ